MGTMDTASDRSANQIASHWTNKRHIATGFISETLASDFAINCYETAYDLFYETVLSLLNGLRNSN